MGVHVATGAALLAAALFLAAILIFPSTAARRNIQ